MLSKSAEHSHQQHLKNLDDLHSLADQSRALIGVLLKDDSYTDMTGNMLGNILQVLEEQILKIQDGLKTVDELNRG